MLPAAARSFPVIREQIHVLRSDKFRHGPDRQRQRQSLARPDHRRAAQIQRTLRIRQRSGGYTRMQRRLPPCAVVIDHE